MFSRSYFLLGKNPNVPRGQFPLGLKGSQFRRMSNNPMARKPWRPTPRHMQDTTVTTAVITDDMSTRGSRMMKEQQAEAAAAEQQEQQSDVWEDAAQQTFRGNSTASAVMGRSGGSGTWSSRGRRMAEEADEDGGGEEEDDVDDGGGMMEQEDYPSFDHDETPSRIMEQQRHSAMDGRRRRRVVDDEDDDDDIRQQRDDYYVGGDEEEGSASIMTPTSSASRVAMNKQRQLLRDINSGKIPMAGSPLSPVSGFRAPSTTTTDSDNYPVTDYGDEGHRVNVGGDLALDVKPNNDSTKLSEVPLSGITHGLFDTKTRKSQIVLPRHLNELFGKISKWSSDLGSVSSPSQAAGLEPGEDGYFNSSNKPDDILQRSDGMLELDNRTGTIDNPSPAAVKANPHLAKHAMTRTKDKLQYGALMDCFENDRHAIENKIAIAGSKFERQFMNWQGAKLLENVPQQQMHDTMQSKGSMVLHSPQAFHIPKVNHDHCPGCGSQIQDEDENSFGYCYPGDVEQYVLNWQAAFRARAEYAERMHELMTHWEKHGKRVGEEWLDFMTQEEFNAIFRFTGRPFICRRCLHLRHFGVTTENMVLAAPDFKEKLAALRDKKCVVVLVIDLSDFPGSMVPDLPGLISMNNPVIIAANKLDTINNCSYDYKGRNADKLKLRVGAGYLRQWVKEQAMQFRLPSTQIKAVVPVSSKRGWGIRELVDNIEFHSNLTLRKPTPPVPTYFVGCANAGKSSLINAIARHLYIPQPPHPTSVKQHFMYVDPKTGVERIGSKWITDQKLHAAEMNMVQTQKSQKQTQLMTVSALPGTTINAVAVKISLPGSDAGDGTSNQNKYPHTYLFDTPGVNPIWQETTPLNIRDQVRCLIRLRPNPHGHLLEQGYTLFIGGVACIDVVKSKEQIMFFSYHARHHVTTAYCETDASDAYWREHAGKTLTPPSSTVTLDGGGGASSSSSDGGGTGGDVAAADGDSSSSLCVKRSYLFECYHNHLKRPKADIYFCGIGWVSFFVEKPCDVVLRVRTLPGIVHGVRRPLRRDDMKPYRPWPRLPRYLKAKNDAVVAERAIDKIIELEDRPLEEGDLDKPPVVEVHKTEAVPAMAMGGGGGDGEQQAGATTTTSAEKSARPHQPKRPAASSAPFDFLMQELHKQGKIPSSVSVGK